jgi:hypothetical protein
MFGYLAFASLDLEAQRQTVAGFLRGLSEMGFVEGRNVADRDFVPAPQSIRY